jgi:hypothetical protein
VDPTWLGPAAGLGIGTIVLAVVVVVFAWPIWWFRRRERLAGTNPLPLDRPIPPDGVRVPLARSITVLGGTPFGGSENSINPLLELHADHLVCRVVLRKTARYDEIVQVDAGGGIGPRLHIRFPSGSEFVCWLAECDLLAVLRFLDRRGVRLTERARRLLAGGPWPPPGARQVDRSDLSSTP